MKSIVGDRITVSTVLISGHAGPDTMLPVAAQLDPRASTRLAEQVSEQALDLAEVLDRMGSTERRLNIVVLDACRDNPFTSEAQELSRSLSRSTGKAPSNEVTVAP